MKNRLFVLTFILIILITLTGCGNSNSKTLNCRVVETKDESTTTSDLKIRVKDNEIKDMTLTINMVLSEEQKTYKQAIMSQMKQKTDKVYSTSDGIKAIFGMNSSYFKTLGISKDASYSEIKQVLELQGYTCEE